MDPLSITASTASIIQLVSSASLTLYTFVDEARNVDQNVKDLTAEVGALERTLLEVDSVLQSSDIASANDRMSTHDGKQLWTTLYGCLEECQVTVVRLDSVLNGMRKKYSNWAKQALGQVKLNLKKDQIDSLRTQIHTHCITLGTALQMINIRATYMAPGVVIDDLGPKIDSLQDSLNLLTALFGSFNLNASSVPEGSGCIDSANTKRLQSLGNHILAKASTLYGSSVGDGSVIGDPITRETHNWITNWIPEPIFHERASSMTSTAQSSRNQTGSSGVESGIDMAESKSYPFSSEADLIDSGSEAEFELETVQGLLAKGKEIFKSGEYKKAVGFLQNGVATFNRLPHNLRSQLDLIEVPLMIATCKFHLGEIDEASNDLVTLVRRESSSDQDAIRKCQVSHLLSQIHLIKNDVDAAEDYCRNSLKGRRRLLGKGHQDYFASLALLSEICLVLGKSEEAAVFKDMLPPDFCQSAEMLHLKGLKQLPTFAAGNGLDLTISDLVVQRLDGHTAEVWGIAFSPDSSLLASASSDKTVRLWEVRTGRELQKLEGHTDEVWGVAFSPDSSLLASVSRDAIVRLWDVRTRRGVQKLEGHTASIWGIAFSPDSSLLASASRDKTVRLWNAKTRREIQKLEGHTGSVVGIAFSPDSSLLASASWDRTVRLWDIKTGREVQKLEGHTDEVYRVSFSPDNSLLASVSKDRTVRLWDVRTRREVQKLEGHTDEVWGVAFSPDSSLLASVSRDAIVRLWDVRTRREVRKLEGHTEEVYGVAFSPDSSLLASASCDRTVRLWKMRRG